MFLGGSLFLDKCQGVADIYFLSYIWEPKPFCGNDAEFIVVLLKQLGDL